MVRVIMIGMNRIRRFLGVEFKILTAHKLFLAYRVFFIIMSLNGCQRTAKMLFVRTQVRSVPSERSCCTQTPNQAMTGITMRAK
jgi:hypothetical protein